MSSSAKPSVCHLQVYRSVYMHDRPLSGNCPPAKTTTSVLGKHLFSMAGDNFSDSRTSIQTENMKRPVFLKANAIFLNRLLQGCNLTVELSKLVSGKFPADKTKATKTNTNAHPVSCSQVNPAGELKWLTQLFATTFVV